LKLSRFAIRGPDWIQEDVNNDGKIDILDVAVIGLHWGE